MNAEAFFDGINIFGLVIGLMNLQENLTQGDKQEIMQNLNNQADKLLKEIHSHLEQQDQKIDLILKILNQL